MLLAPLTQILLPDQSTDSVNPHGQPGRGATATEQARSLLLQRLSVQLRAAEGGVEGPAARPPSQRGEEDPEDEGEAAVEQLHEPVWRDVV